MAKFLPDYKASVENLALPPRQPSQPRVLEQKFGSIFVGFKVHEADAANAQATFCVETDDGTGKGFVFQALSPDQSWHLSTRSSQLYHVRFKIITPAGSSPYSEILVVSGSFKAPEKCGRLRLVDYVGLGWQGPDARSLKIIWHAPVSNCDTPVLHYVVWMQLVCRGVALGPFTKVHEGLDPSCQITGLLPGSSYVCQVSAVTSWGFGALMTFSTQHAPPDQPLPPFVADFLASSIRLSWDSLARCNSLRIQGFVLECLVIDDKEANERRSTEVQDIWNGCMRIEVRES